MPYYATDTALSLETRGAAAALLSIGKTTFTVQDIRDAGASKATAYRILGELRANGYVNKGGGHTWQWLKSYPVSGNPEIRKTGMHAILLDHDLDTSSKRIASVSDFPENEYDFNHSSDDGPEPTEALTQTTLIGLPGTQNPPLAPPPPKARKPRKPAATPEQAAIRRALVLAANWGPSGKAHKQAADNGDALMAFDPGVTPERIERFARRWFPRYSPIAKIAAQKGERAEHPTPSQVAQYWPGFQAWEAAQAEAPPPPPPPPQREEPAAPTQETAEERRARIASYHPFRLAPSSKPAMVAAGRAT